ncbi:MAG: hypothetical protein NTV79_03560 [Candidatus Aureabacteria bacterium]|nr:hypothetical protein [Candidatus Auribacterota bacterium]
MSGILFGRTVFIPSVISIFIAAAAFAAPSYNYPAHFLGVAYSPTHYDAPNNSNPQTTLDAFAKDFPLVSRKGFKVVRSYWLSSRAHYLNFVGEAYRNNLKVIIEVPVNPAAGNNQTVIDQFNAFLDYVKATPESKKGQVMGSVSFDNYTYHNVDYVTPSMFTAAAILVLAGNENIPANPHDSASLVSLKNNIQDKLNNNGFGTIAVSYCLEADVWAGDPSQYPNRRALLESLAAGVPFLMTCYPFEWGMPIDQSVEGGAHALQAYVNQVTGHYPDLVGKHPIMFGETGWASEGTANGSSPANPANEAAYLSKVYTWIGQKTNPVCGILAFEAFDESTKTGPEYQKHYGLWTGGTPAKNGDWKAGLPPPPSMNFAAISWKDYDGDGTSEISIFRPASGLWAIRDLTRIYFGADADVPVSGDYDGDGTTEAAIICRSPAPSLWTVRGVSRFYFGGPWEDPVPADYDGDGSFDGAVFAGESGEWKVKDVTRVYFGLSGDQGVPGDYNGDGRPELAVFRPSAGLWLVSGVTRFYFGSSTDIPIPGNYNEAPGWEAAVFRPESGLWAIRNVTRAYLGSASDKPVPADYDGDSVDDAGIFRDSAGLWSVRDLTRVYFGTASDIPVAR